MKALLLYSVKLASRATHLLSMSIFFSTTMHDYLSGVETRDEVTEVSRYIRKWAGILIIFTGLINLFLIWKEKPYVRNKATSVWKYSLMLKLLVTIGLSPILEKIVGFFQEDYSYGLVQTIRFYSCVIIVTLTSALRFYREKHFVTEEAKKYQELQENTSK